jgi:hypothetical protein
MLAPRLGLIGPKEDTGGPDGKSRTLKLADYLLPSFAVPAGADVAFGLAPDEDPLGNDEVGCCAVAGPGHYARWEDQLCRRPTEVTADRVLADYAEISGYVPGDPSTDVGTYAIDVMKAWRSRGLFGLPPIAAYARVNLYDRAELEAAVFLLGGAFLCLALPRRVASGDLFEADTWDVATDDGGAAGGHLVLLQGDTVNTWGRRVLITPAFIARYCWEAWAVVSRHGMRDGRAFSGLDLDGLMQAVDVVSG